MAKNNGRDGKTWGISPAESKGERSQGCVMHSCLISCLYIEEQLYFQHSWANNQSQVSPPVFFLLLGKSRKSFATARVPSHFSSQSFFLCFMPFYHLGNPLATTPYPSLATHTDPFSISLSRLLLHHF